MPSLLTWKHKSHVTLTAHTGLGLTFDGQQGIQCTIILGVCSHTLHIGNYLWGMQSHSEHWELFGGHPVTLTTHWAEPSLDGRQGIPYLTYLHLRKAGVIRNMRKGL